MCSLLVLCTLAIYGQTATHGFLNFDDRRYVSENPHVQGGLAPGNLVWAFTTGHCSNWHPLTWLSHMLDCQLLGLRPGAHHLTSVALHLANTLLLYLGLKLMTDAVWRSAAVAGLFAIHPLHVESVAWIAERKDVLSGLFWMLTLLAYFHYVKDPTSMRYLLVLLSFALGLMAKPMLVTLPFVLLLLDFWPLDRMKLSAAKTKETRSGKRVQPRPDERRRTPLLLAREKVPMLAFSAASSVVTFAVQRKGGAVAAADGLPFGVRIANAIVSYVAYIGKTIWPARLAAFYPYPTSLPAWKVGSAAALLAGATFIALRSSGKRPYLAVGWLWYLGTLVPVIGLVQVGTQSMADRYTYIPIIGLFIIAAWGAGDLIGRWSSGRIALVPSAATVIVACSAAAWFQVANWKDSVTLWRHALDVTTENFTAQNNLGAALSSQWEIDEAAAHIAEALRIKPDYAEAHCGLGALLARQGKTREAMAHYNEALRIKPDLAEGHYNLALALHQQGRDAEAVGHYIEALRLDPDDAAAYFNLGNALDAQGATAEAIEQYTGALRLKPDYAEAHSNLGAALWRQGRTAEAITHYSAALRIKPDLAEAHYNLGTLLHQQGRIPEAVEHYTEALRFQPADAEIHNNLAIALAAEGKPEEAAGHYRQAIRLKPDSLKAMKSLAWLLATDGNPRVRNAAEALQLAERACELTQYRQPVLLDTLAAAYAEGGLFGRAVETARAAVAIALSSGQKELAEQIHGRLQLYEAGRPYREARQP